MPVGPQAGVVKWSAITAFPALDAIVNESEWSPGGGDVSPDVAPTPIEIEHVRPADRLAPWHEFEPT